VKRFAAVLGDGGWGTALALLLAEKGFFVRVWGVDPAYTARVQRTRANPKFLPHVALPDQVSFGSDPESCLAEAELVVSAVPTQFLRACLPRFRPFLLPGVPLVSGSKGLEEGTGLLPSQVIQEVLEPPGPLVVLSGPSHAEEVARGLPASVVAASRDQGAAKGVQETFSSDHFRVYTSQDPLGVELGGALKNIVAIAAGICDGLGLGDNAKSALMARGLAEMARFGAALGARLETFYGLSGLGDLVTTCVSPHGRNRAVGERLGKGESLELILNSMEMVAEGIWTTRAVREKARALGVELPITEGVYRVLFLGKPPGEEVRRLMLRAPRPEEPW